MKYTTWETQRKEHSKQKQYKQNQIYISRNTWKKKHYKYSNIVCWIFLCVYACVCACVYVYTNMDIMGKDKILKVSCRL